MSVGRPELGRKGNRNGMGGYNKTFGQTTQPNNGNVGKYKY